GHRHLSGGRDAPAGRLGREPGGGHSAGGAQGRDSGPGSSGRARDPGEKGPRRRPADHHGRRLRLESRRGVLEASRVPQMRGAGRALRATAGEETVSGGWVEKAGEILEESRVPYERNFPLSRLTTLGVGGPADFLLRPVEVPSLAQALEGLTDEGIPVVFLGAGSNLLVGDGGFRGVVVCLADLSAEPQPIDASVRAEAGMRL